MFNLGHSCQAAFSVDYLFLFAVTSFPIPPSSPTPPTPTTSWVILLALCPLQPLHLSLYPPIYSISGAELSQIVIPPSSPRPLVKSSVLCSINGGRGLRRNPTPPGSGAWGRKSLFLGFCQGLPRLCSLPALSCHLLPLPYLRKHGSVETFPRHILWAELLRQGTHGPAPEKSGTSRALAPGIMSWLRLLRGSGGQGAGEAGLWGHEAVQAASH